MKKHFKIQFAKPEAGNSSDITHMQLPQQGLLSKIISTRNETLKKNLDILYTEQVTRALIHFLKYIFSYANCHEKVAKY